MQQTEHESRARGALRRGVLLYAVLTSGAAAICYLVFVNRAGKGAFVTIAIVGLIGLLFLYQTLQHARDLAKPVARTEGPVVKKWQRADLIIAWQSYYIAVNRKMFRIDARDYIMIDEGMRVYVDHFPHTLNVISVTFDEPGLPAAPQQPQP